MRIRICGVCVKYKIFLRIEKKNQIKKKKKKGSNLFHFNCSCDTVRKLFIAFVQNAGRVNRLITPCHLFLFFATAEKKKNRF